MRKKRKKRKKVGGMIHQGKLSTILYLFIKHVECA